MSPLRPTDDKVIRHHLQVVHGITVRAGPGRRERTLVLGSRLFGVSLDNVQRRYVPESGLVPCKVSGVSFLVDACSVLLERAGTVGLFRKPGSLIRIKALRAKLNRGEGCLSTALPYDVASLVKCFCRELPQPLFPPELREALLEAQALASPPERTSALQLVSCLLPARNASLLHFLFNFLSQVSQRCADNLMTSSNLAMVFTPCLLFPSDGSKLSEQQLALNIDVLRAFIDNPRVFAVPTTERWTSEDHPQDPPPSTSRPLKRSLGLESFPNVLLFRTYTPLLGQQQGSKCGDVRLNATGDVSKDACRTPQERLKRLQTDRMGSAVRLSLVAMLACWLAAGATGRGPRTADQQVSEAEVQRLLHVVMEQLGIARPRVEYPAHQATNIVGPQSIQGGAHEGLQHLGPYGNIPNIVAELAGDNVPKDFSEDHGYPDPPNPCPVGKTASDGCLEKALDTAEFSREFQQHQNLFDPEHDYPAVAKWNKELLYQKLKGGPKRRKRSVNPYLRGQRLNNVVAKKSAPHFSDEEGEEASPTSVSSKTTTPPQTAV
ncbi:unnamed protein product [Merluccius merluccius]